MKSGQKYIKMRITYNGDVNDLLLKIANYLTSSSLDLVEKSMFQTMFDGFRILHNIQCAYFRVCEYTDGKYTLNVRRDLNNIITILFDVDPYYNGDWLNS